MHVQKTKVRVVAAQNKRILCFVDECGTAGQPNFALGCVMVWAKECGRADKAFSDLLDPNANEIHAGKLETHHLQGLLGRFAQTDKPQGMILMNRLGTITEGTAPAIYAANVIETVKVAMGQFRDLHFIRGRSLGNIELVLDRNHHNTDPEFQRMITEARQNDGRFKAVDHVVQLDSAASRILQLADVVAYARTWINRGEQNARGLRENYGIRVL